MKEVTVWNSYIRINHWLMVILFSALILTGKSEEDYVQWHFYLGYMLSSLVLMRLLYGVFGSKGARFRDFIKGPVTLITYIKALFSAKPQHYLGHNPLGALMVIGLLLLILVQVASGLVSSDDVFWYGPLYEWVSDDLQELLASWHMLVPDLLLALVAIHLVAVLIHDIGLKERLVRAMIKGKKTCVKASYQDSDLFMPDSETDDKPIRGRFIIMLLLSLAWLYWLWQLPI